MILQRVDMVTKLSSFSAFWSPRVVVAIEPAGVVNSGEAGGPLTAAYDDSWA